MECLNRENLRSPIDYAQLRKKVDDALDKKKGKYVFFLITVYHNPKSIIMPKSIIKSWEDIQEVDLNFKSETIKECKYIQKVAEIRSKHYPPWFAVAFFLLAQAVTLFSIFISKGKPDLVMAFVLSPFIVGGLLIYNKADKLFTRCNSIIENTEKRILSEKCKPDEETGTQT